MAVCNFTFVSIGFWIRGQGGGERVGGGGTYEECSTELRYSSANLWSAVSPEAFQQVMDQKFIPNIIIL
jgi:hypothetical protein